MHFPSDIKLFLIEVILLCASYDLKRSLYAGFFSIYFSTKTGELVSTRIWILISHKPPIQLKQYGYLRLSAQLQVPYKSPLVKMDIEGSEYSVLKDLASNRLLCKKHIDTLLVELHGTPFNFNVSEFRATMGRIRDEVNSQNCAVTEILPFWDESYLHDVRW